MFFNEGATGFVLRCQPLVGGSLEIQDQLAEFFRTKEHLPEGASLQVLLQATPHIEESIALWASKRMPSYQTFAKRRSAFLAEGKKEKMAPLRDYTILLSLTVPELLESVLKKEAFLRTLSALTSTLKLLGMSVEVLDAHSLIHPPQLLQERRQETRQKSLQVFLRGLACETLLSEAALLTRLLLRIKRFF